jgi:hypothetical protein
VGFVLLLLVSPIGQILPRNLTFIIRMLMMTPMPKFSAQLPNPGVDGTPSQNLTDFSKNAGVKTR